MFLGSYDYTVDQKGRIVIPSKFKLDVNESLYLMKGFDGCISIYKSDSFLNKLNQLSQMNFENDNLRKYQRLLLSTVVELVVDKSGRILLPINVIKQYSINKDVKIVGLIDHFEIWNKDLWIKYNSENEKDFESFAEELFKDEK